MIENAVKLVLVLCAAALFPFGAATQDGLLHMAVGLEDKDQVEILISSGVDVNQTIKGGTTPLMLAARSGNTEILRLLLDANARVDQANTSGNTALIMAVHGRKPKAVEMLLQRNADPSLENREGLSADELAKLLGYTEIERVIEDNRVPEG